MLEPGFWRHKAFNDVFIEVLDSYKETHSILWWNLGFTGNPWLLTGNSEVITITDPENWTKMYYDDIVNLSKSRGNNDG